MPPKKQQKGKGGNAFYYFMLEFRDKQGRKYNMREAAEAASPHWANMSPDQKKPYEERAAIEKSRVSKLTSDGYEVDDIEREQREEQARIENMREDIDLNLKLSMESGHLRDEMFFIIHVNIFCYCAREDRYSPAEIAVAGFSLEDGVLPQNIFHHVIKPGPLPFGYTSDAMLVSKETHQIPPPLAGDYDSNMEKVYFELKNFLSTKLLGSKRYPPLYADEKMMKMTQQILDTWCGDFDDSPPLFKVYELQYMFRSLKNIVAGDVVWPNGTYSDREIQKDTYSYANGICCQFHNVGEVYVFCSRSIVVRYAYIICDNCCQNLNIILVPGTHIPDTAMNPHWASTSSKASSVSGSARSFGKLSLKDYDSETVSVSSKSDWDNGSMLSFSGKLSLDSGTFPELGPRKKYASSNSQPKYTSESNSQPSSRSYAGAMGTSGLSKRVADVPSSLSKDFNGGRDDFYQKPVREDFKNDVDNFPMLGKERGMSRGRRLN